MTMTMTEGHVIVLPTTLTSFLRSEVDRSTRQTLIVAINRDDAGGHGRRRPQIVHMSSTSNSTVSLGGTRRRRSQAFLVLFIDDQVLFDGRRSLHRLPELDLKMHVRAIRFIRYKGQKPRKCGKLTTIKCKKKYGLYSATFVHMPPSAVLFPQGRRTA